MPKKNIHAAALGKRGGKADTDAQRQARRKNLAKARQTRWSSSRVPFRRATSGRYEYYVNGKWVSRQYLNQVRNPQARAARQWVAKALKDGTISIQACERCGNEHTQAHHDDHSKPDAVRWLCRKHHLAADRGLREKTIDSNKRSV